MQDDSLKAVHSSDLKNLLQSLGVYETVNAGNECCLFCNNTVAIDSIAAVFPHDNKVAYCCDTETCYTQLMKLKG